MKTHKKLDKNRLRAARYEPGPGYEEAIEMTLKRLPRFKRVTLREKALLASAIAAAVTLFLVFAAPPIVRAAGELYQRLFGDVAKEIETRQARPEDEKLSEMTAMYESGMLWHEVEGASARLDDVTIRVDTISLRPAYDEADVPREGGQMLLSLTYSQIPPFDPSWVDFTLLLDGKAIPMRLDETFAQSYRAAGGQTLTEEEWADEWSGSNSSLSQGVPTTWLWFELPDWRWEERKELAVQATIDGEDVTIPFAFDPRKAHEAALEMAKESVALFDEAYPREAAALLAMEENAAAIDLRGNDFGYDWTVSQMSHADGQLHFSAAFGGLAEETAPSFSFWVDNVTVDGVPTGLGYVDNNDLTDGVYTGIFHYPLGRDPQKLPEESLISLIVELGDTDKAVEMAFRYNWAQKRATLPADRAEAAQWFAEARALGAALDGQYPDGVGYDLTSLDLVEERDGVGIKITGAHYEAHMNRLVFFVRVKGDDPRQPKLGWPTVTINGQRGEEAGSTMDEAGTHRRYDVSPLLSIAEFAHGEEVTISFPLGETDEMRFQFAIDGATLEPLRER